MGGIPPFRGRSALRVLALLTGLLASLFHSAFLHSRCWDPASRGASLDVIRRRAIDKGEVDPDYLDPPKAVVMDAETAERWKAVRQKAKDGDAVAQFKVGKALHDGVRVTQDLEEAVYWLSLAADAQHTRAKVLLATMYLGGDGTPVDQEQAFYLMMEAADEGHVPAQFAMGNIHYDGIYLNESDTIGSAYWFKKAAENGHAEAQYRLAGMLLAGDGLLRNATWAAEYFLAAAEQGHTRAQEGIGLMLWQGNGMKQNMLSAIDWLSKAAEGGIGEAAFSLGTIYRKGYRPDVPIDLECAIAWLTHAADLGHIDACKELGVMYLSGEGTEVNEEGAAFWFEQARVFEEEMFAEQYTEEEEKQETLMAA